METTYGPYLPENLNRLATGVDQTLFWVHVLMLVLLIGWSGYFLFCLVRFRIGAKNTVQTRSFRFPFWIECGIVLAEIGLFLFLSIPTWGKLQEDRPKEYFEIHAIAEQFAWNFHYPGADGLFANRSLEKIDTSNPMGIDKTDPNGKDDLTVINTLHVPIGKPILIVLSSKDVIHNFYIPVMRVKQDIIPGSSSMVWFDPLRIGEFDIACAQLCGLGHYRMRGILTVESGEDFKKWYDQEKKAMGE